LNAPTFEDRKWLCEALYYCSYFTFSEREIAEFESFDGNEKGAYESLHPEQIQGVKLKFNVMT